MAQILLAKLPNGPGLEEAINLIRTKVQNKYKYMFSCNIGEC